MPFVQGVYDPGYFEAYRSGYADTSNFGVDETATLDLIDSAPGNADSSSPTSVAIANLFSPTPLSPAQAAAASASSLPSFPSASSRPSATPPLSSMPQATVSQLPSIVGQAQDVAAVNGQVPDNRIFGPSTLLNPLPQIVAGPKAAPGPNCNFITQWVSENPLMALGVLVVGFVLVSKKKG